MKISVVAEGRSPPLLLLGLGLGLGLVLISLIWAVLLGGAVIVVWGV